MKKLIHLALIAFAIALQSCSHSPKNNTPIADSLTKADDTVGKTTTVSPATVNSSDAKFAAEVAEGGLVEAALANLALKKGNNIKITTFANWMIKDHTGSNNELLELAKAKNIVIPTVISPDEQRNIDSLNNKSALDFDRRYVAEMIVGHQKALKLYKDEATEGTDKDLKAFANKAIPIVQMRLDSITKIHQEIK